MIKVMSLMKRREGMEFGEFRKWLLDEHVAFARNLPGLRKYTANALISENPDAPYDGITELFFDDEAAMAAAFATDAGNAPAATPPRTAPIGSGWSARRSCSFRIAANSMDFASGRPPLSCRTSPPQGYEIHTSFRSYDSITITTS
jgi:uncharacterized protein (TIGR02118 family)